MKTYLHISNLPPNLTHFRYLFILIVNAIITNIIELFQLKVQSIKSIISVFFTKTTVRRGTNFIHLYSKAFYSIPYRLQHFLYKNAVRLIEQFSIIKDNIYTSKNVSIRTVLGMNNPYYYPFGMAMGGRNGSVESYRFGFNGMEKDDEVNGNGNHLDMGARAYDNRLGRFMSIDRYSERYPDVSPYLMLLILQ